VTLRYKEKDKWYDSSSRERKDGSNKKRKLEEEIKTKSEFNYMTEGG